MLDAKVGTQRIPAGLPREWRVGHKTGTGDDETNDVGFILPPGRAPILFAAFYARGSTPAKQREAVLCEVGTIVAAEFTGLV